MANRKSTKKYYFSVEGETEQWYLKWLQDLINGTEQAAYCKCQYKNVGFISYKHVGKPTRLYEIF